MDFSFYQFCWAGVIIMFFGAVDMEAAIPVEALAEEVLVVAALAAAAEEAVAQAAVFKGR